MLITVNRVIKRLTLFTNTVQGLLEERDLQARNQTEGGGGGGVSPALFQNLKKSALILGKNALTRFIYGFSFSFKMLF